MGVREGRGVTRADELLPRRDRGRVQLLVHLREALHLRRRQSRRAQLRPRVQRRDGPLELHGRRRGDPLDDHAQLPLRRHHRAVQRQRERAVLVPRTSGGEGGLSTWPSSETFNKVCTGGVCTCDMDWSHTEWDEFRYQHRGYGKYADLTRLFGWEAWTSLYPEENTAMEADPPVSRVTRLRAPLGPRSDRRPDVPLVQTRGLRRQPAHPFLGPPRRRAARQGARGGAAGVAAGALSNVRVSRRRTPSFTSTTKPTATGIRRHPKSGGRTQGSGPWSAVG